MQNHSVENLMHCDFHEIFKFLTIQAAPGGILARIFHLWPSKFEHVPQNALKCRMILQKFNSFRFCFWRMILQDQAFSTAKTQFGGQKWKLHEKLPPRISRWPVKWVHHQEKRMSIFGALFLHPYRGAILLGFLNLSKFSGEFQSGFGLVGPERVGEILDQIWFS